MAAVLRPRRQARGGSARAPRPVAVSPRHRQSTRRSAPASASTSSGATRMPASAGTVSGMAPALVPTTGRPCAIASAIGHAVALEARGQHEHVGCRRRVRADARAARRRGRRCVSIADDARCRHRGARRSRGSRVRSPAIVSRQGRSASVASAAISTSKPLRGTTAPTESSRTMPSRLPRAGGDRIVARPRDRDAVGRHAVIGRSGAARSARW